MNENEEYPADNYKEVHKQDKLYCLAHKFIKGDEDKITFCLEEDKFYFYIDGIWLGKFDVEILKMIGEKVPEVYKFPVTTRKQIIDNLKVIKYTSILNFNLIDMLNLKNGMIDPYSHEILKHEPLYMSTIQINYNYDKEAKCNLWIKTLNEILEKDQNKISILQEFFGYCLTRETKYEKALLLLGDSRSGKSTILNTLNALVGKNNCSNVPLSHIGNQQQNFAILGKLINLDTDVSSKAMDFEAEFKKITSGESIQTNPKYVTPFSFNPFCKIVLSANDFPRISDHSSAFYKRLIIIPCDRVFQPHEQNVNLKQELLSELPGILNWALEGLERLRNRGSFEKKEFMEEAISELRDESNPVDIFFNEHIVSDVKLGNELDKGELYNKYKSWCITNNHYAMSAAKFSICVFRKYAGIVHKNSFSTVTRKRIWKNLSYVNNKLDHIVDDKSQWQD